MSTTAGTALGRIGGDGSPELFDAASHFLFRAAVAIMTPE
jgi:hypothetical protein